MPSRNLENHWSVKLYLCAFTLLPYRGAMLLLEQYRCMTPEKCQDLKCAKMVHETCIFKVQYK